MGICAPDSGEVIVREGVRIQMIFQDSAAAFNPHMTIAEIIAEPLVLQARRQRRTVVRRCFAKSSGRGVMQRTSMPRRSMPRERVAYGQCG